MGEERVAATGVEGALATDIGLSEVEIYVRHVARRNRPAWVCNSEKCDERACRSLNAAGTERYTSFRRRKGERDRVTDMRPRALALLITCTIAGAPRDLARERQVAHGNIMRVLQTSKEVRTATLRMSKLISIRGLIRPDGASLGMHRSRWTGIEEARALVSATTQEIWQHIEEAFEAFHPLESDGTQEQPDLREAVRWSVARGTHVAEDREAIWAECEELQASLLDVTRRCMAMSPEHVQRMPAPGPHIAWLYCCATAMEWPDRYLIGDLCCGAPTSGDIPDSGVLRKKHRPMARRLARCGHDEEPLRVMSEIEPTSPEALEVAVPLWDRTMKEVMPGHIPGVPTEHQGVSRMPWTTGPFSKPELDTRFGEGCYVPLCRFGVCQGGALRPCDNGARSGHNKGSSFEETITCETADFPARVSRLFTDAQGGRHEHALHGGTDDMEKAYRRVAVDIPQVVALWDPFNKKATFFIVSGFPFGLASAVNAFNRLTTFMTAFNRRVLYLPSGNYYDDFVIIERAFAAHRAQAVMGRAALAFGYPFSKEKHKPAAITMAFLGVATCFLNFQAMGIVSMFVAEDRVKRLTGDIKLILQAKQIQNGGTAKLVGRLLFTLTWTVGTFGKAVLQPLFAAQQHDGPVDLDSAMTLALGFFVLALAALKPRVYNASRWAARRPILIWTDAMYAPGAENGGAQAGFNAFIPDDSGVKGRGRWIHGSAKVSQEFIREFLKPGKTYIGQLELLAAVSVYYSIDPAELRDRKVIHWIDNTGALAAMVKGYAKQPDTARIVHAFSALVVRLGFCTWFEYVRTKANLADLPSREGLQGYEPFEETEFAPELGSVRVDMNLPPMHAWANPFGDWIDSARADKAKAKPKRKQRYIGAKRKDRG